ncbi:MAG: tetratricopeptide repeat protein [Bacteroidota bacterium]
MAIKKRLTIKEEKLMNWKILLLLFVSFAAYSQTLGYDFVDWDDIVYIMNNSMITAYSWINLKKIFTTGFMGNYHPLILLSFSFDYHFFRFSAPGYHFHNLLLHVTNVFLVYTFFFHLLRRNTNAAIFTALVFALHPMHVESVAWVSERKDVLYTFWYFLSLTAYLYYLRNGRQYYYLLALGLFILSCLSKAQAVTLPVVLLLIDYYSNRKPNWKMVSEKLPFFLLAVIFGIIAIYAQDTFNSINPNGYPADRSLFYGPYSLCLYLFKFIFPVSQIAIYEYPLTLQGTVPLPILFSPAIFLLVGLVIWKTWRSNKYITFGLLFFLVTIFPVLQFLPVGPAVAAERYTYIPYVGMGFIVAMALQEYRAKLARHRKTMLDLAAILILAVMTLLTWNRTQVWKDSIALWSDVIEKNPVCCKAYTNRAFMYNQLKEYDKALKDLNEVISIDPDDSKKLDLYISRAFLCKTMGRYDQALADYSSALKLHPDNVKPCFNRGIIYADQMGKHDSAIMDFKKFLKRYPADTNGNFNLGITYYKMNNFDSAKRYFLKSLQLDSVNGQIHGLLANVYYQVKDYPAAYRHGILAQQYGVIVDHSIMSFLIQQQANKQAP